MMNPRLTIGSSFVDDFWIGSDLVHHDYFWLNRSSMRWLIQVSPVEAADPTGVSHFWKMFHWWFLSLQRLSFRWLFLNPQRLCAPRNPLFTCESSLLTISESSATQISLSISEWTRALCANEFKSYLLKRLRWYFWFCSDSVFVDYFWVNSCFMRWRIHALPMEAVLLMIYESVTT